MTATTKACRRAVNGSSDNYSFSAPSLQDGLVELNTADSHAEPNSRAVPVISSLRNRIVAKRYVLELEVQYTFDHDDFTRMACRLSNCFID